jgi:glycosyltransferase involved in cell wall biosynthesis
MTLRVVHVVPPTFGFVFSGQTNYILSLFRRWNKPGIIFDLYGSSFDVSSVNKNYIQEHKIDQPANWWTKSFRLSFSQRILWSIRVLLMIIFNYKNYDILHFHGLMWGGLLSPLVAHLFNKKVIYTISLLGNDNPSELASARMGQFRLALFKQFDGVIGLSEALIQDCRKYNFSSELLVLPNFMIIEQLTNRVDKNHKLFARNRLNIPPEAKVILFVGSIIKRKGADIAVETFIRLARDRDDLMLLMVGPQNNQESNVDEGYVQSLKQNLHNTNLQDRVFWAGMIREPSILTDYYRASDIFLFPTRAEGQGNVILEAMASELPVVTTYLEGITDMMVTSGVNGYLIDRDDVNGFIKALQQLLTEPDLRRKMGTLGSERVRQEFGFKEYCDRLARFYYRVAC